MELTVAKEKSGIGFWMALTLLAGVFAMVTIVYGLDWIVKGAHDTFHDFRHVIGMPCH